MFNRIRVIAAAAVCAIVLTPISLYAEPQEFIGKWSGTWSGVNPGDRPVLPSDLHVNSVDGNGVASGTYAWGNAPQWGVSAGSFDYKRGQVRDDTLQIDAGNNIIFKFVLNGDETIAGSRLVNGKPNGMVRMKKAGR